MASSKDKAIALKDNYVAGLIEAGATAPMPTMPEQDMGQQASVIMDIGNDRVTFVNDGDPMIIADDGRAMNRVDSPEAAFPINNPMNLGIPIFTWVFFKADHIARL